MNLVVGSGPAGVACAMALVQKGQHVTMLDAGLELEPERQNVVDRLALQPSRQWQASDVSVLKENMDPDTSGVPLKYVYGSDFPYRNAQQTLALENQGSAVMGSLAKAGFSNAWGAGVLPYTAEELRDWPIDLEDLAPHYRAVLDFVDMSAADDDLSEKYPLYTSRHKLLSPSAQTQALLGDLGKRREKLKRHGISFGYSRLAVRAAEKKDKPGCAYCGLCMYGCPYGLIYCSAQTLDALHQSGKFDYVKGVVCRKVRETSDGEVQVEAQSLESGEPMHFQAQRVFLACGAASTTRVLLESLEAFDQPVRMLDSQYFLLPMMRYRATRNVTSEELHTLSQLYLEITNPKLSSHTIHLSLYTYNELFLQAIEKMLGPLRSALGFVARDVAGRLVLCGGYLHSSESPGLELRLSPPSSGSPAVLHMKGGSVRPSRRIVRKLAMQLFAQQWGLKAMPAFPMIQVTLPGRGFHTGGTFPMHRTPSGFQSDVWGRPAGMQRVHAVDASVFPAIPSGPITLSVMANAHRIASASVEL